MLLVTLALISRLQLLKYGLVPMPHRALGTVGCTLQIIHNVIQMIHVSKLLLYDWLVLMKPIGNKHETSSILVSQRLP